jgi:hypothetical protein
VFLGPKCGKMCVVRSLSAAILRLHKQRSCTRREEKWAPCNPTSEAQATKNAVALEPALAILIPSMAAAKNEGPAVQTQRYWAPYNLLLTPAPG